VYIDHKSVIFNIQTLIECSVNYACSYVITTNCSQRWGWSHPCKPQSAIQFCRNVLIM